MRKLEITNKCIFHRHSKNCACEQDMQVHFKTTHKTNRELAIEQAKTWLNGRGKNNRTPGWKFLIIAYADGYMDGLEKK